MSRNTGTRPPSLLRLCAAAAITLSAFVLCSILRAQDETLGLKFFTEFNNLVNEADQLEQQIGQATSESAATLTEALVGIKALAHPEAEPEKLAKDLDKRAKKAVEVLEAMHESFETVRAHASRLGNLIQRGIKRLECNRETLEPATYEELRDQLLASANRVATSEATLNELKGRVRDAQRTLISRKPELMARLFLAVVTRTAAKLEAYTLAATKLVDDVFSCLSLQNMRPAQAAPAPS